MAPIEIDRHGDWAIGLKQEERRIVVEPGGEINIIPKHDARLYVECYPADNGGKVIVGDPSWKITIGTDGESYSDMINRTFELGENQKLEITRSGRKLADVKHIPSKK